jgi:hypothetical protein
MFGEMTKTLTREIANPDNKLGVDLFQDGKKVKMKQKIKPVIRI